MKNPVWQQELAGAVRQSDTLCTLLDLDPGQFPVPPGVDRFPLRVPRGYIARMTPGDPCDPLLLQVLPRPAEAVVSAGYMLDPVGDQKARVAAGVLHKYHDRLLLMPTGVCPIHCRYCFRRHFPHERFDWHSALTYLATHGEIQEVILSGGDPLLLSDARLVDLLKRLETIPHLRRLRIHTRVPVVLPERVNDTLCSLLGRSKLSVIMVLHSNHANEWNDPVRYACTRLAHVGVVLFNQSVLLCGINDRAEILIALSEALFKAKVIPYYLHLFDPVQGAAHFAVPVVAAVPMMDALRTYLPGYLVPRLVRECVGAPSKMTIS